MSDKLAENTQRSVVDILQQRITELEAATVELEQERDLYKHSRTRCACVLEEEECRQLRHVANMEALHLPLSDDKIRLIQEVQKLEQERDQLRADERVAAFKDAFEEAVGLVVGCSKDCDCEGILKRRLACIPYREIGGYS